MLQWQQAIETFLGFEAKHDKICVIKQNKNNSDGIL